MGSRLVFGVIGRPAKSSPRKVLPGAKNSEETKFAATTISMERTTLLGMPADFLTIEQAVKRILELSEKHKPHLVVTPNVDHFLRWRKDQGFREIYRESALSVLDGQPLVWLAKILGNSGAVRVAGVDLVDSLLSECERKGVAVAILGGSREANEAACAQMITEHPKLNIFLSESPTLGEISDSRYLRRLQDKLSIRSGKIVLLCFGSPKQELLFLDLARTGASGVFIGAGATVDFLSGNKKRAPRLLQNLGLEWAYRLCLEPRRLLKRYLSNGVGFAPIIFSESISRLFRRG